MHSFLKKVTTSSIPEAYVERFERQQLTKNIDNSKKMSLLVLVLEFVLLAISFYPQFLSNYGGLEQFYRISYLVIILGALIYHVVITWMEKKLKKEKNSVMTWFIGFSCLILLFICSMITTVDQSRGIPSSVMIFIMVATAVTIHMSPLKSFLLFTSSHIIFLIIGNLCGIDSTIMYSNYINMTSVTATVCALSYIIYQYDAKSFLKEIEIEEKNDALMKISTIDPLTGLGNRRYLDQMLEDKYLQPSDKDMTLTAMMIDVDYFKGYNDTYGHVKGDKILSIISAVIDKHACDYDGNAFRYGGDEVLILIKNKDKLEIERFICELRKSISVMQIENKASKTDEYVTLSIGYDTSEPTDLDQVWELINKADQALYESKKKRKHKKTVVKYEQLSFGES